VFALGLSGTRLPQRFPIGVAGDAEDLFGTHGIPLLVGERVAITCFADSWRQALFDGGHALRRALQYGFQLPELDEVRRACPGAGSRPAARRSCARRFERGRIFVEARVGDGRLRLEPDQAALASAADDFFEQCGLGAHRTDELERLTAGREVEVALRVEDDHVALAGAPRPDDLLFQCEMIAAWLRDPGWREDGIEHVQKLVRERFEAMDRTPRELQLLRFWPDV